MVLPPCPYLLGCFLEGNWVRENTGSGVEGTLIWTENHTPFMVDRTPSLENEKVYDRDA
jgi:hypothetical protein